MQGIRYDVDLVLCIDATGSMAPIIKSVKESALKFHADLQALMIDKSKNVSKLRLKVIVFRDLFVDGAKWLSASEFYELPAQAEKYSQFVNAIEADGGGDEPESALEALALAIKSDWTSSSEKKRHVIVLWTDASSHPLEKGAKASPANLPSDLPKDFGQLTDLWDQGMNHAAKRLLVYGPDAYPWTDIGHNWENTLHFASKAGAGLADHEYKEILDTVANSI